MPPPPKRPPPPRLHGMGEPEPAKSYTVAPREPVIRPSVVLLNAVEGWGKTTVGANAPSPLILMSGNETGYDTLLGVGSVPRVPAAIVESWTDALGWVRSLASNPQGIKTLVLDAIGGFEALCKEHVCQRDFKGDWGESGFASYGKGYDATAREWHLLIQALEQLREKQAMQILMLGHVCIKVFKNPTGVDYSRYQSDVHEKVWGLTAKFCDAVLFGQFHQFTDVEKKGATKGKAAGGAQRVVITQRADGYDAKNRYGMPERLWLESDAAGMYAEIWQHIKKESV